MRKPLILFVCKHNTGRSQMAEAYLRHFAGESVEVASAGTIAAGAPRCGRGCGVRNCSKKAPRIDDDWGLPDPKGQSPERVREIRDMVKSRARALAEELA